MTSANRIGVSSGTNSSRGVRSVSWSRRRTSVAIALNFGVAGSRRRSGRGCAIVVMSVPFDQAAAASRPPVSCRYTSSSVGCRVAIDVELTPAASIAEIASAAVRW